MADEPTDVERRQHAQFVNMLFAADPHRPLPLSVPMSARRFDAQQTARPPQVAAQHTAVAIWIGNANGRLTPPREFPLNRHSRMATPLRNARRSPPRHLHANLAAGYKRL